MKAFIKFVLTIEDTWISLGELSDANWLMDIYPTHLNDTTNQIPKYELRLSIRFEGLQSSMLGLSSLLQQQMLQHGPPIISEFKLNYAMDRDPEGCRSAILDQLSHIHKNVHRVELEWIERQIESEYIITLLGSNHSTNVKWLKIDCGAFKEYNPTTQDNHHKTHNITRLKFKWTEIACKPVLPLLPKDFPYLEHLKFRSCDFGISKNTINIYMESTAVGTLEIKYNSNYEDVPTGSLVLLSVDFQDQNISKYYMQVTSKPPVAVYDTEEDSEDIEKIQRTATQI